MAIESHLQTLEAKHQELENLLTDALAAPSTDDLLISSMKRKKLHIKEKIENLRQQLQVPTQTRTAQVANK